jgi:hypothetical protein
VIGREMRILDLGRLPTLKLLQDKEGRAWPDPDARQAPRSSSTCDLSRSPLVTPLRIVLVTVIHTVCDSLDPAARSGFTLPDHEDEAMP